MEKPDHNDNAATRLIALFVILLLIVACVAVFAGIAFMVNSGKVYNQDYPAKDYSIASSLCFLAAAVSLIGGLSAVVKLVSD